MDKIKMSESEYNKKILNEVGTLTHAASILSSGNIEFTLDNMRIVKRHLEKLQDYEIIED